MPDADDVQANAIWQVQHALLSMRVRAGTETWRLAALAFNFGDYDQTIRDLKLSKRRMKDPLVKASTVQRRMNELDPELSERLEASEARPTEAEVRRIKDWEAGRTSSTLERWIPAVHGRGWDAVAAELLNTVVYAPLGPSEKFVTGTTRSKGEFAYAFTSHELLAAFQQVTQPRWAGRSTAITGAELVGRIHRASYYIGLLVNPPPVKRAGATRTLALSALDIARLASKREEGTA